MKTIYRILAVPLTMLVTLTCAHADIEEAKAKATAVAETAGIAIEHGIKAAEKGVEHGAHAAVNGVQHGAKAAAGGIERGAKATAKGVEHGADATARAADNVARKIGSHSEEDKR